MTFVWIALAALAVAAAFWAGRRWSRIVDPGVRAKAVVDNDAAPQAARALLQSLPDAGLLIDGGGRVIVRNAAAGELTGAAEGKPIAASFRVPDVLEAVQRVIDGGPPEASSFILPVPVERSIEAHVAPLLFDGRLYALVVLHDTTAMTRVERMRADFVANASHELRTPLASLSGFIETIQGPARDDPEAQHRFLAIMQTQAARMRRLIDDLLSLSRIELNEHVRPSHKVDLGALVHDVIDASQPQLAQAGIKAVVTIDPAALAVLGERDELLQVFQNLVDNAIKYGADGGDIAIAVSAGAGVTTCSVADRGPGIAREHIPRLTERFYRVDAKTSRERGGTGLGLAIVKHIVNRHRGRLEIESEPDKGSRFTAHIPVWIPPAAA